MEKPVKLSDFLWLPDVLAKTIGIIPFEDETKPQRFRRLMKANFIFQMININVSLLAEILFVIVNMARGENFIEATMTLSYIGFVFVGDLKIFIMLKNKHVVTILMKQIRDIYPTELELQKSFDIRNFFRRFNIISLGFVLIHEILIWSYNLYIAVSYLIYDLWLGSRIVPRDLPYYFYIPWKYEDNWSYYVIYVLQNIAGHTCMAGQLISDLMLCMVATQIIMHYRYLAQRIEKFEPKSNYEDDRKFLSACIEYHQKILNLTTHMNEIFGISLLVNFISSTFIMCFLGFQMTTGNTVFMLYMFLFCSLVQILMICNYGQELIVKSESIGHAVYNHNWLNADVRYRKMLILIIERSQKPARLKATFFLNVSMATMTDLVQLSYKFFALLRTMYSK